MESPGCCRRSRPNTVGSKTGTEGFVRTDSNVTNCRIGQKLDILHRLPQVIEYSRAALKQGAAILGRFNALAAAVEQAYANGVLQLRDRPRNGGLGSIQDRGRLAHAAGLHHAHQNVQIVQLHPPSNAIAQFHTGPSSRYRYDNIE